ncbi:endonuclease/exonuclease/phosphatase family protein [Fulvivirga imtechensis AK7]|uniref:Endonuclease/exonuclease/phosphatase family protein n=1 Tax=Fulvivirga imtechensis AK7 TaxID=1237149 RepID=L8JNH4_9BACT|nr:endonuclease/exonuclease/phosphatase family protein [Fulvivirga imtechensis]ELR70506.1 endonuclease/exonuclease/phosphatase family protein [Fulvivirga imtechensis AK7]
MTKLVVFVLGLMIASTFTNAQTPIKVMTFNIRYDSQTDYEQGNGWKQRRDNIVRLIRHYDPDLLGLQEAEKHQLDFLLEQLQVYDYIGISRDNKVDQGEYSAILYRKDRFKLGENSTFWLSETPETPSKGWDANLPRIVTWGEFDDKKNNKVFYFFNTHFDHIGVKARENSAQLVVKKIGEIAGPAPVILSGDFNATPEAPPYAILTEKLKDAKVASAHPVYGPDGTFSGFELSSPEKFPRIDYMFVRKLKVQDYETIADFFNDKFASDHLPIVMVVDLQE